MKRHNLFLRLFAVVLTFCFTFTSSSLSLLSFGADDEFAGMTVQEKQAAIEQRLKEVNEKLAKLGEESKETKDYIDTLNDKIGYLQKELKLADTKIESSKTEIQSLEQQYKDNEKQIEQAKIDIEELSKKSSELKVQFDDSYIKYCQRLRAMYVSGNMSTLSVLLTSPDISTLLIRLEMIKRVSMSDKNLLEALKNEAQELIKTKEDMQSKQQQLSADQKTLVATQESLKTSIEDLEVQQIDYAQKQEAYESQRAESDEKLKQLHEQENAYSEYRNRDEAELNAINAEIAAAAEEFRKKLEAQTTTAAPTTTAPPTTQGENESQEATTQAATTTTTTTQSSNGLSMTMPVPSQTNITCGYGSAGYAGHTGVDFSCPSGSTVVAAESGYVIISTDLVDANGNYRSYGRYIVIMHDKTDSAGNYVYTLYAHNSARLVSTGDYVAKGQAIAQSGSTGNSTGPHLHFEVRTPTANYSDCVDPTPYLGNKE